MGDRSDPGRPDFSTWRTTIAIVLTVAALVWAWVTQRGDAAEFPASILQAEGLLLTALVFSLGFAQQGLRRTLDESIAEAREREKAILDRYTADDSALSTLQLYEIAYRRSRDAEEAVKLVNSPRERLAAIARRYRRLPDIHEVRFNQGLALASFASLSEREEDEPEEAHRRRLERLRKGRPRLEKSLGQVEQEWRSLKLLSGAHGNQVVSGVMRVGAGAAFAALSFANVFIVAMVGLFLLGGVYAGWAPDMTPGVQFWVGVTPIGLALAYVQLIKSDMGIQLARFADRIKALPLSQLHLTEWIVTSRGSTGQQDLKSDAMKDLWESEVMWRLKRLESELSEELPWMHSLRGRMHLAFALAVSTESRGSAEWRSDLAQAESYLRLATKRTDDPVPLIALARCLEEKAGPAGAAAPREARQLVGMAAEMIGRWTAVEPTSLRHRDRFEDALAVTGWKQVRTMLNMQRWYWPRDPNLRALAEEALEVESAGERRTASVQDPEHARNDLDVDERRDVSTPS